MKKNIFVGKILLSKLSQQDLENIIENSINFLTLGSDAYFICEHNKFSKEFIQDFNFYDSLGNSNSFPDDVQKALNTIKTIKY